MDVAPYTWEKVTEEDCQFLFDFALASHDEQNTRTAELSVVQSVFEIAEESIENNWAEKCIEKHSNSVVGFYCLKATKKDPCQELELSHLYVHQDHFGKGIGSLLFKKVLEKCKALPTKRLYWVSVPAAKDFYLRMGGHHFKNGKNWLEPTTKVPLFQLFF